MTRKPAPARAAAIVAGLLLAVAPAAAQFTPGSIVVLQVGNGSTPLSAAAAAGTLVELNPTTGLPTGVTVALPTAAAANAGGVTFEGSAGSISGFLHLSADGRFLTTVGYDAPVGTASVASSAAASANRTIVRIAGDGTVTTQRLTDSTFDGGAARSAASDGTQVWLGGTSVPASSGGVRYVSGSSAAGSASVIAASSSNVVRDVVIVNNRLVYSSGGTTATNSINLAGGTPPPTGTATATTLASLTATPNGFVFLDRDRNPLTGDARLGGVDTLYLTDGQTIDKLEWGGSGWAPRGQYNPGQLGTTLFALTGTLNGSQVDLYATDTAGKLAKITDTSAFGDSISSSTASDAWAAAYNPGVNYSVRGVDFAPAPVPEPAGVLAAAAAGLGLAAAARRLRRRCLRPPAAAGTLGV